MSQTDDRHQTAARIRIARKLAGLSQAQVAKFIGVHRPTISEIEAGRRRVATDELTRLADLFDVDLGWLVGRSPPDLSLSDPSLVLAARELQKLRPEDVEALVDLLRKLRR